LPKVTDEKSYGSAREKIARLGLTPLYEELVGIIEGFQLLVAETKDGNSAAEVRVKFDAAFNARGDWKGIKSGGIDWSKCLKINGANVCLGVEVQFSGRSDSGIIMDLIHLRGAITRGLIDVGVLIVADNTLGVYLTDRTPRLRDAERHIVESYQLFPLLVIAVSHDGPGRALPKREKRPKSLRRAAEPPADYRPESN
jgi:hypothetical protein